MTTNLEYIGIDFGNLENELNEKNCNLLFIVKNNSIFLENKKGDVYSIERLYIASYLDDLIQKNETVVFKKINVIIPNWKKENRIFCTDIEKFKINNFLK